MTSGPSTGGPPRAVPTSWCGPGGPNATGGSSIVLDTGRTSAGRVGVDPTAADPGGWPRLDWSLDAALLLAALASRAGDHVDFLAHDRVTRAAVFGASRTELLAQLVDAMAPLQPALDRIRLRGQWLPRSTGAFVGGRWWCCSPTSIPRRSRRD